MAVAASSVPVTVDAVLRLPLADRIRHPLYWQWIRFLAFGRALPAVLFALLGWGQLHVLMAVAGQGPLVVLPRSTYLLFCTIPVAIFLTRKMPVSRDGRLVARLAAFTGTTIQMVIGAVVPRFVLLYHPPTAVRLVSSLLSIAAFAFAVYGLGYLRRNLSIIPEARRLVTTGPYRIVRHPLYLAESTAALALVIAAPYVVSVITVVVFVSLQVLRSHLEDRLLATTFPEHADYRRRTRRLVPFVW